MNSISVAESNLSIAWAKVFIDLMKPGREMRHPATIILDQLDDVEYPEHPDVRTRLDEELTRHKKSKCGTVAGTIFPRSMWNPLADNDARVLFERYTKAWPGIAKCPANRKGVYFRRLTAFEPADFDGKPVNQLEYIIHTFRDKGNHRKSALQASLLDPTRDHTHNRIKGFPCLQQVSFTPLDNSRLSVAGYYATQYQFEKAYGNYLGLFWLGRFMAKQLGLQLSQVVCFASVLSLGEESKDSLRDLEKDMKLLVAENDK